MNTWSRDHIDKGLPEHLYRRKVTGWGNRGWSTGKDKHISHTKESEAGEGVRLKEGIGAQVKAERGGKMEGKKERLHLSSPL